MAWYQGPTLIEAIDSFVVPNRYDDKPLRVPVSDVYKISGIGTVITGRICAGIMKPGMKIQIAPTAIKT